jgi:hypothetical protein
MRVVVVVADLVFIGMVSRRRASWPQERASAVRPADLREAVCQRPESYLAGSSLEVCLA